MRGKGMVRNGFFRVLAVCLLTAAVSGCVHRTPFPDESYITALGAPGEIVITASTDRSMVILDELAAYWQELDQLSGIIALTERLNVSIILPGAESGDIAGYYGAIEGNISMALINAFLSLNRDWVAGLDEHQRYYRSSSGIEVSVPENGILFFSSQDISPVLEGTYRTRKVFVPDSIAVDLVAGMLGIYIHQPVSLTGALDDLIPGELIKSIDSLWLAVDSSEDFFDIHGMIVTDQKPATTVISITLKKKYLEKLRRMDEMPDGWQQSIVVDNDLQITINSVELQMEDLRPVIESLLQREFEQSITQE